MQWANGSHTLFSTTWVRGKAGTHILIPPSPSCWCKCPWRRRINARWWWSVALRGLIVIVRVCAWARLELGWMIGGLRRVSRVGRGREGVACRIERLWRMGVVNYLRLMARRHWRELGAVAWAVLIVACRLGFRACFYISNSSVLFSIPRLTLSGLSLSLLLPILTFLVLIDANCCSTSRKTGGR